MKNLIEDGGSDEIKAQKVTLEGRGLAWAGKCEAVFLGGSRDDAGVTLNDYVVTAEFTSKTDFQTIVAVIQGSSDPAVQPILKHAFEVKELAPYLAAEVPAHADPGSSVDRNAAQEFFKGVLSSGSNEEVKAQKEAFIQEGWKGSGEVGLEELAKKCDEAGNCRFSYFVSSDFFTADNKSFEVIAGIVELSTNDKDAPAVKKVFSGDELKKLQGQ
jgi:hypothetical protein